MTKIMVEAFVSKSFYIFIKTLNESKKNCHRNIHPKKKTKLALNKPLPLGIVLSP